jgi:hypothetical protein
MKQPVVTALVLTRALVLSIQAQPAAVPADTDAGTEKEHSARFQAQTGYQITEVVGTLITARKQSSAPRIVVSDDKRSVTVGVTLTGAGRFAATLMTRQSSAGR